MGPTAPRVYLTLRCDMKPLCSYCSNGPHPAHYREASCAEWRTWLRRYPWIHDVVLTGGQPTLHAEFFDLLEMFLSHASVEVYSNFNAPLDWARIPDFGRLRWRASCHAQTVAGARLWLDRVHAAQDAGQRVTLTTVLPPPQVVEVLRSDEVVVDAPQQRPTALPPPVECLLPRLLIGPEMERYCCVGKLVRADRSGIVDMEVMSSVTCMTPDRCAVCDSLASERRLAAEGG